MTTPIKGIFLFSEETRREERLVSVDASKLRSGEVASSWLHTRNVLADGKMCFPTLNQIFCSVSHTYIYSGCQKYCLKLQTRHKHPVRFKDQLVQIVPFQTKYFDAVKLISGTTVLGKAIMDMSGAILLWQ